MKIGIVGLPNVGKSTLFKALTKIQVDINNYPFCTIKPNIGIVEVPDNRVDKLANLFQSEKKTYTTIEFVDIAGLVEGASTGEGLGNQFLHNIREVDAIVQVVRFFENPNITHVRGKINPKEDIQVINTELILADLATVEKRLAKLNKEVKGNDKEALIKKNLTEKLRDVLNENSIEKIHSFKNNLEKENFLFIADLQLLSFKPILYLFNTCDPEGDIEKIKKLNLDSVEDFILMDIKIEEELLELSNAETMELGLKSHLSELIKKSHSMLGLISFLTAGKTESRAWKTKNGALAPQAASSIHGDFEKKFICAEVVAFDKLIEAGSKNKAKELGYLKIEGKNYQVKDGDVIEFRI